MPSALSSRRFMYTPALLIRVSIESPRRARFTAPVDDHACAEARQFQRGFLADAVGRASDQHDRIRFMGGGAHPHQPAGKARDRQVTAGTITRLFAAL